MTPETKDWIDLIVKLAVAIAAVYGAWKSSRNAKAIEVVRTDVNDKMQQFIQTKGEAEHAKGVIEGHQAGALESKGTSDDPIHVEVKGKTSL